MMKIFIFILICLNLSYAQKCTYNQNFDIVGTTFGTPILTATFDQCCYYCSLNSYCQAWNFYKGAYLNISLLLSLVLL